MQELDSDHDPVQLKWMRIRICNLRKDQKYALVTKYLYGDKNYKWFKE